MEYKLISSYKNASLAVGLTVIVDVLRACSTVCYIFGSGAKEIFPVKSAEEAFVLKKQYSDAILVGERNRVKIDGFDFSNSPTEILAAQLQNRTVIFTTSAGVQGMVDAVNADELVTGAFVNVSALVSYIKKKNPAVVSFVISDDRWKGNEDDLFTHYTIDLLQGNQPNFPALYAALLKNPGSNDFIAQPVFPGARLDFEYCMKRDVFPFVVRAEKKDGGLVLARLD